jgi:penicillin-binding protein 2
VSVLTGEQPTSDRRPIRFVAFAVAVVLGVGTLTGRLVQLQLVQGGQYSQLSAQNSRVVEPIPSSRGLIYDRNGTELVENVPSFSVKIRPADLPLTERATVLDRLAGLLDKDVADLTATLDANVGSRFDLVRVAQDVPEATARIISENHDQLPGVQVVVEAQRSYPESALVSQIIGYTGPIDAQQLADLKSAGYQPDDMIGKAGVEASYESYLRGTYGSEEVERDAQGRELQVLQTLQQPQAGDSLKLSIDVNIQAQAEQALKWAMGIIGNKRGVIAVENPQTGEILALVSLPTYDDNLFAKGISAKDYAALVNDKDQPLLDHAISDNYPPGSTYKLVTGTGGLADKKIGPHTQLLTKGYLTIGTTKFIDWNHRGFGMCDIYCGFAHSSDTFFYQVAARLGIDRLGYWAKQYGFGAPTGIDLPGEVAGTVPTNQWKMDTLGAPIYPGEVYQAGIGQGYDVVTPIQLLVAFSTLANGGKVYQPQVVRQIIGPDGQVVRDFKPILNNTLPVDPSVLKVMREASRNVLLVRHTYNLVDLPIVIGAKTGTAEFGLRDAQGRLPFHSWFAGFVAGNPWKTASDPTGMKAIDATTSQLAVVVFAYDSRTIGNAATEIAKYFLQLHYGIQKDYRMPWLLQRGNFYGLGG